MNINLTSNTRTSDSAEENINSNRAHLFGYLVRLAQPIVTHFQSDLYHDVHWIDTHVNPGTWLRGFHFFYGVRDTGTTIGTDHTLVALNNPHVWCVRLYKEESAWTEKWCVAIDKLA